MTSSEVVRVSEGLDDLLTPEEFGVVTDEEGARHNLTNASSCNAPDELNTTKIYVLSSIIVCTIFGNVAVILAIFLRQVKISRMYYFILHLSLADLLTAFFTLLPEVLWTITLPEFFLEGDLMCRAVKYMQMVGPYLSSYVLIMTAIDRYQAICHPLSNCAWTPKRSNSMIAVAWIISVVLCIPQAFIFYGPKCGAHFPPDWGIKAYVTGFGVTNFFIPLVFLLFCYGCICSTIWENFNSKTRSENHRESFADIFKRKTIILTSRKTVSPDRVRMRWRSNHHRNEAEGERGANDEGRTNENQPDTTSFCVSTTSLSTSNLAVDRPLPQRVVRRRPSDEDSDDDDDLRRRQMAERSAGGQLTLSPRTHCTSGISRAKIKTVKLTVVVIAAYIICSAPFICVQLYTVWGTPPDPCSRATAWLFWLLTLNSVVNPWIYMFFNVNLVETLRKTFCFWCKVPSRTLDTVQVHQTVASGGGEGGCRARPVARQTILNTAANPAAGGLTAMRPRSDTGGSNTSVTALSSSATHVISSNGVSGSVVLDPHNASAYIKIAGVREGTQL